MKQVIVGFQLDEDRHWVLDYQGRANMLGKTLDCIKCQQLAPRDWN